MKHRYGSRRRSVTVGAPCVEGEQCAQYAESQESHREEDLLVFGRDFQLRDFKHVHGFGSGTVEDTQDTDEQECRATHQHQGQLHGRIFFSAASPHTDKEVHRNQSHLVEHEHGEQVGRNKESEYTGAQQGEPHKVFLGERFQLPGSERSGKHDNSTQQQHDDRDTVDSYRVSNVQRGIPNDAVSEKHFFGSASVAESDIRNGEVCGKNQQDAGACYHHSSYLIQVAGNPQAEQHQQRN